MKLLMVRHGQTAYNNLKLIQGHIDLPLNQMGQQQAKDVADYLLDQKISIDSIVTSPLKRAHETAIIIKDALAHDQDIIIFEGLIERNFGDLDGMTIEEAFPLIGSDYQQPGYETDKMLLERILATVFTLEARYLDQTVLAVVHSQVIKAMFVHLDPKTYSFVNFTIQNGEVIFFEIDQKNIELVK